MNVITLLLGIFFVIGGFVLSELKKDGLLKMVGSFAMLCGLFLTFAILLNMLVPNFFKS